MPPSAPTVPLEIVAAAAAPLDHQAAERVQTYHGIARSCAAYAVYYGAMAGQELDALRSRLPARKFQPFIAENMPWLPVSTAYLYLDYAKRLSAKLESILPAAGRIDLAALPDPRDHEAAEKSEVITTLREKTGAADAQQLWLALGLVKERKDIDPKTGKRTARPRKRSQAELHEEWKKAATQRAKQTFAALHSLDDRWMLLDEPFLKVTLSDLTRLAKQVKAWLETPAPKRAACSIGKHLANEPIDDAAGEEKA